MDNLKSVFNVYRRKSLLGSPDVLNVRTISQANEWVCHWKLGSIAVLTVQSNLESRGYLKEEKFGQSWIEVMASRWFQTEVVKFIALLFPFWSKLKIWSFSCHSCCTEVARKFTTEPDAHEEMYFLFIKPIILHSTW